MTEDNRVYYLIKGKLYIRKLKPADLNLLPTLREGDMKYVVRTGHVMVIRKAKQDDPRKEPYLGFFMATPEEAAFMKTMVLLHS